MAMLKKSNMKAGGEEPKKAADATTMQQWNQYVDWLDSKGMRGSPDLDKTGRGYQMMDEYRKVNPAFNLTKDDVGLIQQRLLEYRGFALDRIKNNKAKISVGGRDAFYKDLSPEEQRSVDDNFMGKIKFTSIDNIPGQFTTSTKFPSEFISNAESKDVKVRVGFADAQSGQPSAQSVPATNAGRFSLKR